MKDKKLVEGLTDKEIERIEKQLMRAYNEICKIEKVLKQKGSEDNAIEKIQNSTRNGTSNR